MRTKGWDMFFFEPGEKSEATCLVCKAKMNVKRDIETPTSSAEAMGKIKSRKDVFTCPDSKEDWHKQVLKMKQFIIEIPSLTLAMLVEKEMNSILKNKKATKKVSEL